MDGRAGSRKSITPGLENYDRETVNQCLRDIVALSTMPAVWSGAEPLRIAESLAAALFTTLDPHFVYVCFADRQGGALTSVAQVDRYQTSPALAAELGPIILDLGRTHDPEDIVLLPSPRGSGTLRLATRGIGHHAELGVIAAAFKDDNSPTSVHHLVLNVAATQAATTIQNMHLLRSLRESEEQFASIFNQTTGGVAQTDLTGRFVRVNNRYCEIVGRSHEELLKLRLLDITHPDDIPGISEEFQSLVRGEIPSFVIEKRDVRPDGSTVWVHSDISGIRDAQGRIHSIAAAVIDITERKRAEQQRDALLAREIEARTEAEILNASARVLAGQLDLQAIVQSVTDAATRLTGAQFGAFFYNVTDEEGQSYLLYTLSGAPREAFEKFGLPRNTPLFDATFQGSAPVRIDDVLQDHRYGRNPPHRGMPKGHLPVRSYLAVPVVSRSGEVLGGLFFGHSECAVFTERAERLSVGIAAQAAIAIDNARLFAKAEKEIALRKEAESVLRGSEQFNRSIVESSRDCIKVLDVEGCLLSMTRAGQEMVGISDIEPFLNKPYTEFWEGSDREAARAAVEAAAAGQSGKFVGFFRTLRGEGKWWDVVISPILDAAGRPERLLAVSRDITEEKNAEQALRESEERYRTLIGVITDVPWRTDPLGAFVTFQTQWAAYTGQSWEEQRGFGWVNAVHPDDRNTILATWEAACAASTTYESHGRLWHAASRQYRYFEARGVPMLNSGGSVHEWVGTCTDVHERRQTEALVYCQKQALEMAASGAPMMQILDFLARAMESQSDRAMVAIHLLDKSGTRFEKAVAPSLNSAYVDGTRGIAVQSAIGPCCAAVARRTRVFVAEGFPVFESFAKPFGIRSGWSIPILSSTGRVLGTAAYYYPDIRDSQPQDDLLAEIVGRTASTIIEGKHAEAEREALLKAAQKARAEAEESNRLKDEFLAVVSHELRTPLNAVLGWAHMLRVSSLEPKKAESALETIERNARAQNQLIDDLLDVSRIVSGKLRLDAKPIDPASFIEAAIESLQLAAEARQVSVQKTIEDGIGSVFGDADRLQQVVWNLLSNSIKFTPAGGRVQVRLRRLESHIEIVISDTGMGIKPEFLPFVFDRFRQADGTISRAHGGLGLGLAIVRHLVELHGGEVRADSPGEGRGATFTVLLPFVVTYRGNIDAHLDSRPTESFPHVECSDRLIGLRVLVVDDEPDTCELLRTMLTGCGAEVITTTSANLALKEIERFEFDLIVSDIGMPGTDGYQFMECVRRLSPDRARTPAIALTAYCRTEDRLRALRAGYQMHVPKPVEYVELITVMASLAAQHGVSAGSASAGLRLAE